ncbi:hypothetical protein Unana1_00069 [Umbelopsis nana]
MKLHAILYLLTFPFFLTKTKDKVNLQWSICDSNPQIVLQKLGKHSGDPDKLDPITYYDTDPPVYTPQGLMFRTKTRAGQEISLVKVRFAKETSNVPHTVACRWDRYGDKTTYVCKMQAPVDRRRIWSDEQVRFAEHYYSRIVWDELVAYGPYSNPKWKWLKIKGYKAVFDDVAARSHHLMELEVKVPKSESDVAYQTITEYLKKCGVMLCDHQESKTMRLFHAMGYYPVNNGSLDVSFHEVQR